MKLRIITLPLLALLSAALPVRAEDPAAYPTHKIKMLLPYAAGGGGDVIGRLLADKMGKTLGRASISRTTRVLPAHSARRWSQRLRTTATPSPSAA
ncbi:hypothetical protein ACQ5SK_30325 [Bradyrhizobium japonicum]